MNNSEPLDLASGRNLNESAIYSHAVRCSCRFRANHFTRVGQDFIDEVKADVEAHIRAMRNLVPTPLHEPLEPDQDLCFTTGVLSDKIMFEMNRLIGRIIQSKVQRNPTVGKTLRATR